jgi:hypothetical protein
MADAVQAHRMFAEASTLDIQASDPGGCRLGWGGISIGSGSCLI